MQKIEFFISSTHFSIHFAVPLNVWYLTIAPPLPIPSYAPVKGKGVLGAF